MKLIDLIGFQMVDIDDEHIVVRKNDINYTLNIIQDEGGCCGYNDLTTVLFFSKSDLKRNPVITDIELIRDEDSYCDNCKITFFGEYKPMAYIDSQSGSGSGWCYGSNVCISCKSLDLNEVVTSW